MISEIANRAIELQAGSLCYYWPADSEGRKDIAENNLAMHFAAAFLEAGYGVFAEVDHPDPTVQGIDLLAISRTREHFVACEFKRHFKSPGLGDSVDDVERLLRFRLNHALKVERCGVEPLQVLKDCRRGFGLVAGLRWCIRPPAELGDVAAERVRKTGGAVPEPILVKQYVSGRGAYYLQYGFFQVEVDDIAATNSRHDTISTTT